MREHSGLLNLFFSVFLELFLGSARKYGCLRRILLVTAHHQKLLRFVSVRRRRVEHKKRVEILLIIVGLGLEELLVLVAEFKCSTVSVIYK